MPPAPIPMPKSIPIPRSMFMLLAMLPGPKMPRWVPMPMSIADMSPGMPMSSHSSTRKSSQSPSMAPSWMIRDSIGWRMTFWEPE